MYDITIFSKRLREERIMRNLTQKDLAIAAGITPNAVTMYETAKREPSFACLYKICDFLNVSADYLIGRTDEY